MPDTLKGRDAIGYHHDGQRRVLRKAAQQRHGGVAMGIDQPREQRVAGQVVHLPGLVLTKEITVAASMDEVWHCRAAKEPFPGEYKPELPAPLIAMMGNIYSLIIGMTIMAVRFPVLSTGGCRER